MPSNSIADSAAARGLLGAADTKSTGSTSGTNRTIQGSGNDNLGFQDFLTLIVAQMQNQDMMNPMDNTAFVGQMAQMAVMQAVNQMTEINVTQYGVSMLGKEVTAAVMKDGELEKTVGVVTGVALFEGQPIVYIGDKSFALSSIMAAGRLPEPKEDEPSGGEDGDGGESNPDVPETE